MIDFLIVFALLSGATVLHELAHFAVGQWFVLPLTTVRIWSGTPILHFYLKGVRFLIGWWPTTRGSVGYLVWSNPKAIYPYVLMTAAGPACDLLLALGLFCAGRHDCAVVMVVAFVINALPVGATDGAQIRSWVRHRRPLTK